MSSIVAKDGFNGDELELNAVIEKHADGWFWAEYDDDGVRTAPTAPEIWTNCHRSGSDYVRAFRLL